MCHVGSIVTEPDAKLGSGMTPANVLRTIVFDTDFISSIVPNNKNAGTATADATQVLLA